MGNPVELTDQARQLLVANHQRVTTGEYDFTHLGVVRQVSHLLIVSAGIVTGAVIRKVTPKTVPAMDRASTCQGKQDPAMVLVYQARYRHGFLITYGISTIAICMHKLTCIRQNLQQQGVRYISFFYQRCIISCDPERKFMLAPEPGSSSVNFTIIQQFIQIAK